MSREKDTEDGDRRGLVEEGAVGHPEKSIKSSKGSIEWVHQPATKSSVQSVPTRSLTQAIGLPEVWLLTDQNDTIKYWNNDYKIIEFLFILLGNVSSNSRTQTGTDTHKN